MGLVVKCTHSAVVPSCLPSSVRPSTSCSGRPFSDALDRFAGPSSFSGPLFTFRSATFGYRCGQPHLSSAAWSTTRHSQPYSSSHSRFSSPSVRDSLSMEQCLHRRSSSRPDDWALSHHSHSSSSSISGISDSAHKGFLTPLSLRRGSSVHSAAWSSSRRRSAFSSCSSSSRYRSHLPVGSRNHSPRDSWGDSRDHCSPLSVGSHSGPRRSRSDGIVCCIAGFALTF